MNNRLRPLARAWGASGLAIALAVGSHLVAGGHAPQPTLVLVAWALGAVVALPFTRLAPSTVRLAGLLLPAQLIYHLAFGGAHPLPSGAAGSTAGLGEHAAHLAQAAELAARSGALGTSDPGAGALAPGSIAGALLSTTDASHSMVLAHVLSALASVLLIRHAERCLAAAWRWCTIDLCGGARLPRVPVAPARPHAVVPSVALPRPHTLGLPLAALRHRGPPALPAFA